MIVVFLIREIIAASATVTSMAKETAKETAPAIAIGNGSRIETVAAMGGGNNDSDDGCLNGGNSNRHQQQTTATSTK